MPGSSQEKMQVRAKALAASLYQHPRRAGHERRQRHIGTSAIRTLTAVAETSYATCGDLSLAYQVFGEGPVELVLRRAVRHPRGAVLDPARIQGVLRWLSTFCRVLIFDKAGVGLSDPVPRVRSLDDRAAEIEAVMDAAGFEAAVLSRASEGGPAAIVFAATRPERTRALVLAEHVLSRASRRGRTSNGDAGRGAGARHTRTG